MIPSPKKVLFWVNQVEASSNKISGKIYGKAFEKSRIFSQSKLILVFFRLDKDNLLK
jgi:hypothetical protein